MKKLVVFLMLIVITIGAKAQTQQGESSFGLNVGYGFDSKNAVLGLDYRYNVTDAIRLSPELSYFVKNNGTSAWAIDMNAHYVFQLSNQFGFYPLAGLSLSFWKFDLGNFGNVNKTRFGANVGMGVEVYATDQITVGLEGRYNIIKDFDQALLAVRVGYNF